MIRVNRLLETLSCIPRIILAAGKNTACPLTKAIGRVCVTNWLQGFSAGVYSI